jgi:hypothetical protein
MTIAAAVKCGHCQRLIPQEANFCSHCGTSVGEAVNQLARAVAHAGERKATRPEPRPFGGWLLLWCIAMPLSIPAWLWASVGHLRIAGLIQSYAGWDKYSGAAFIITVVVGINTLFAVISVFLNVLFFRKSRRFPAWIGGRHTGGGLVVICGVGMVQDGVPYRP